jgi:hypothetical protein
MAHCWFGRPLVLAALKATGVEAIESEMSLGCDGFVLQLTIGPDKQGFKDQAALFEQILQSHSQTAFVYLELKADGIEGATLEAVRKHTFPSGYMIASRSPGTLVKLWRLDPAPTLNIALIVEAEKDFSGLEHCPYTTVEIADHLATHEQIRKIHNSAKEVFVRSSVDYRLMRADETTIKRIEKRLKWLIHEGVDAIISNQPKLLTRMMCLSRRA